MRCNMRHFANFGIVDNIKNSSTKQRLGAGAGLLGLAAAGSYAGYKALKGEPLDLEQSVRTVGDKASELYGQAKDSVWNAYQKPSLDSYPDYAVLEGVRNNIPQYLQGSGTEELRNGLSNSFGMSRAGESVPSSLKGTIEGVYRNRPNTPRDNLFDAIRYPDLRGQQFAETGERIKTVAGNLGKKGLQLGETFGGYVGSNLKLGAEAAGNTIGRGSWELTKGGINAVGNAGKAVYHGLQPDPYMLQARPEDYLSGKYNLDNLSTQDTLTLYEKMKERGLPDADRMLSRGLKKGFSQQ